MAIIRNLNDTLLFFFIFTIATSAIAYFLVINAYDVVFEIAAQSAYTY